MRQVFTSPRLENVEAVAELLRAEGIEVKVSNDRSYRGNRRRSFSYRERETMPEQPAVWIVRAEDQPRGRQLLRDAGLLDSSREGASTYLSAATLHEGKQASAGGPGRAMRIKLGLLLLIGVVIALAVFGARRYLPEADPAPALPTAPARALPPPVVPEAVDAVEVYRADVPTALVAMLVGDAIATRAPARACVSVDGGDPSAAALQAVEAGGVELFAESACPQDPALHIAVRDYMTDGSGSGQVTLGIDQAEPRKLDVEREGKRWRVLE